MSRKTLSPTSVFEMVLRAHETGGVTFVDVRTQLKELLAAGAAPGELLETLRRQEQWEPLPETAHAEIVGLLDEAIRAVPQNDEPVAKDTAPAIMEPSDTVATATDETDDFEEPGLINEPAGRPGATARDSRIERPARGQNLRSLESRIAGQQADYTALTRSYERAREAESVATARAQQLGETLAEMVTVGDAMRTRGETSLREARDAQAELDELKRRMVDRDAQQTAELAVLQQERARTVALLSARTNAATQLESELQALREASAARDVMLAEARRLLGVRDAEVKSATQLQIDLQAASEALAAGEAAMAELQRVGDAREAELKSLQAAFAVEQKRAQESNGAFAARVASAEAALTRSENALRQAAAATPAALAPAATVAGSSRPLAPLVVAAVILLCAVAVYFLSQRAPSPTPVVASVAPPLPKAGTVIRDCLTCPEITVLPTGKFSQGSAGAVSGPAAFEKPLHVVAIKRVIGMATNLVTVDEFQQFITASGWDSQGCNTYDGEWKNRPKNSWSNPGFVQTGKHPVTCASWNDAEAYAKWLSAKSGHAYRLPSASEWEYAARGGGEAVAPWSADAAACANANVADQSAAHRYPGWAAFGCDDGYVYTSPVGSFKANAFGLNDMLGNVFQWTEDCWHPDYVGAPIDGSARTDGACAEHELRGGSWFTTPAYVRANYRNHFPADYRSSTVGIRLVRDFGS